MTAEQLRRIQQARRNHRIPPRTHGARIRDAIAHTQIRKPDTAGGEYRVSETSRNADDTQDNTPFGG